MFTKHSERKNAELSSFQDYYEDYNDRVYSPSSPSSSVAFSPSSTYSPLPSYTSTKFSDFEEEPHSGRHHHHHDLLSTQVRRLKSRVQDRLEEIQYGFRATSDSECDDDDDEYQKAFRAEQQRRDEIAERDQSIIHSQMEPELSYAYAMKKQWVAASLSVNLSLLRAKRRVRSLTRRH
ncbi:hypothetical protein D9757_001530 [Collybiopsis confluens]|uniref:Uncharacterized protein n=1 Tax=Collybiopsis confluens TaxID=2823264 RepID=A0A8H5HZZ4_9AGAR|nr:hypothetical protein D9757_001530 [Collybiopsis confluens]